MSEREGTTERTGRRRRGPAKPPAGRPADGKSPPRQTRRAQLNREVLKELHALRTALHEMTEAYELRVGSRLNELYAGIEGDPSIGLKPQPLSVKTAEAVLAAIAETSLKPRKGRAKDFARLDRLTDQLTVEVPPPG